MIDDEDAMLWAVAGPGGVIGILVLICLVWAACHNAADCAKRACPNGSQPRLLDHQCLCTTEAKP